MNNAQVTLVGNTTRAPELKFVGQSANLSFGIAVEKSWKDKNDEWQTETSFFDVVAWRNVAEEAARSLANDGGKGVRVVVIGELKQRSYETKEGEKRYVVECIADEIAVSTRHIGDDFRKYQRQNNGSSNGGSSRPARPQQSSGRPAPAPAIPEEEAW